MKKNKIRNYTDIERNNRMVMTTHFVVVIVMLVFCLLQMLSALITLPVLFIHVVLGLAPVLLEWIFWKKNTKTAVIKHSVAIGFAVYYTFALFTAENNLVFLFVVPLILAVSVYNDTRYTLLLNICTVIESFLVTILGAQTGGFGYAGMDSAIIQNVIMILIAFYSFSTAKTLNLNMTQKLDHIHAMAETTENGIAGIYQELEKLNESSKSTRLAMEEVSSGTTDTANAVQNQLLQTQEIQNQVRIVDTAATQMSESIQKTLAWIEAGNRDIEQLVGQVDSSVATSSDAVGKLHTLDQHMKEMNSIIKLIDDIAFQTNILALNANVEAARAGEAGRGFAVVASQVSEMSIRTKAATENISDLIRNVSVSITEVVNVMQQMIQEIDQEKACTSQTTESFASIQAHTHDIRDHVLELVDNTARLTEANRKITDSIQTISAVSEEVSALAGEAMSSEERNAAVLDAISGKMQLLVEHTKTPEA